MRWLAFLRRRHSAAPQPRSRDLAREIEDALARRKAGRADRIDRARRGTATKVSRARSRDPILNEPVPF